MASHSTLPIANSVFIECVLATHGAQWLGNVACSSRSLKLQALAAVELIAVWAGVSLPGTQHSAWRFLKFSAAIAGEPKQEMMNQELMERTRMGDASAMQLLLSRGADVNTRDSAGMSVPFFAACGMLTTTSGHRMSDARTAASPAELVRILVEANCDTTLHFPVQLASRAGLHRCKRGRDEELGVLEMVTGWRLAVERNNRGVQRQLATFAKAGHRALAEEWQAGMNRQELWSSLSNLVSDRRRRDREALDAVLDMKHDLEFSSMETTRIAELMAELPASPRQIPCSGDTVGRCLSTEMMELLPSEMSFYAEHMGAADTREPFGRGWGKQCSGAGRTGMWLPEYGDAGESAHRAIELMVGDYSRQGKRARQHISQKREREYNFAVFVGNQRYGAKRVHA